MNTDPPIPSRFPVKFPHKFDHFPYLVIILLMMIHVPSYKAQTLPGQLPVLHLPREPSCVEASELQAAASEVCLCPYTAVSVVILLSFPFPDSCALHLPSVGNVQMRPMLLNQAV